MIQTLPDERSVELSAASSMIFLSFFSGMPSWPYWHQACLDWTDFIPFISEISKKMLNIRIYWTIIVDMSGAKCIRSKMNEIHPILVRVIQEWPLLWNSEKNNEKSFENQQSSMWEIDHNTNPDHWVEVNPLSHDWVESTYHWRCSLKCHGFEQKFCFEMHFQSHCHFKTKNPHHGQSGFCAVADRDDTRGFNTTVSNLFESVICRRLHT